MKIHFASLFVCLLSFQFVPGFSKDKASLSDQKATIYIFIRHDCPVSNGFAPEINRITKKYQTLGFQFEMVYDESISAKAMRKHAHDYGYKSPLIEDKFHLLAKRFGATITPEAVVVLPNKKIVYRGRINDQYRELFEKRPFATKNDLRDVLEEIESHRKITESYSQAIGCIIEGN